MAEMRSPQRELPLEIVQAILGTYDAEAFPSFRVNLEDLEDCPPHIAEARTTAFRCSLVSHSFRQHLLPRIFARVTIQSKARLDSFVSLLKSNPQISSHIVGLDLHQLCQDECHRPELEDDFITLANEDPSNLSALFLSLQHSSTLRELSIMFECHPEEPRQAAFSQSTLNEIVKELLMGVPLLSLRLRAIRLPLEVVELIPTSLSYLSVVGVEIDSAEASIQVILSD
ncbi:hypothetical protein FA15DRAFT_142597 [Coprinopsis marcescibilis]|uniref:F-box domain-containing protein n=1 Tax=Coprinopsis marcescibilis TaxID=230819 RepID=A0A5C3KIP8_COPMA|nr:hypothetical protein FA15DRAFT_142597 [Coprinopsis marcescibilis]